MDIAGTPVRFTTVSPGLCGGTEFSVARFKGDEAKVRLLSRQMENERLASSFSNNLFCASARFSCVSSVPGSINAVLSTPRDIVHLCTQCPAFHRVLYEY